MDDVYFEELSADEGFHCHETDYAGGDWSVHPHWHYYVEVVLIASGRAEAYLNGEYHRLEAGDFVFIDSLMIHSFYGREEWNTRIVVIKFNKRLLLPPDPFVDPLYQELMDTDHRLFRFGLKFSREEADEDGIGPLIAGISREYAQRRFGYELAARTMIGTLFLWVARRREADYQRRSGRLGRDSPAYRPLMKLMEEMAERFREPLDAAEAAKRCNMSYSYFSRMFKRFAGRTFSEHLGLLRVMEAEKLLLGTDGSVTEIAMQVGFADTSYFIKQFRKFRALSPLQYRKKLLRP